MARSNNPANNPDRTGSPTGRPTRTAPPVDHGLPWTNQAGGIQAGAPAPGHSGYDEPPAGQLPWPQHGQAPQGAPSHQPYAQQPSYPQQGYAQPGYPAQQSYAGDPQFDQYLPQIGQPPGYPAAPAYQDPNAHLRGGYPQQAEAGYAYAPHAMPDPRTQDPHAYEFSAYSAQPQGYPSPLPVPVRQQPTPPPPHGYAPAYGQQPQAATEYDHSFGSAQAASSSHNEYEDDYDDEDEDADPPRRFGILKIAASLIVAIGLGGGAAYAYKTYGSKLTASRSPVVLKADAAPAKSLVASQNSGQSGDNAADRVGDTVPQVVPNSDGASTDTAPAGARKVQTIAITPVTQGTSEPPLRPTLTMPGLAVEGLPSGPQRGPQPVVATAPAAPSRAPVAPKVIASLEQPVAAAPIAPPAKKVAVAKAAKPSDAFTPNHGTAATAAPVTTATAAVSPPPAKAGGNGYVAVLFSAEGNAIAARKQLDAMQEKYTDVLGGKPTDITEFANPKDGKTYLRAIVGPPGSRQAANAVCAQLKAAGHGDCFAAAY